jgi:hypothetical protein
MPTSLQGTVEDQKSTIAKAAASLLPRRRFFDDMPDKGLFAGTAALGFALIVFLKILHVSPEAVSGLAVALMSAYGVVAYRIPAVRLRLDRLGDNFYYLGFIYTLASLSAALIQIRTGIDVDAVLGSFGIALITTIAGIAGRVVFVQMRSEIDDVEEVIRRDILEASAHLKGQLSAALNDLDTFRTGLRQIADETLREHSDYGKAHVYQIASVAQEASAKIAAAFDERKSQAQELLKTTVKLSAAVDKLAGRMEDVDLPVKQLTARLGEFTAGLEGFIGRVGRTADAVDKSVDNQQSQAQALLQTTIKLAAAVDKLVHRMEAAEVPNQQTASRLAELTGVLREVVGSLGRQVRSEDQQSPSRLAELTGVLRTPGERPVRSEHSSSSEAEIKRRWWKNWSH